MSDNVIVMIEDIGNTSHVEMKVLSGPDDAARHIESLIESGFEEERIRAFYADRIEMHISHRPVVAFVKDQAASDTGSAQSATEDHSESVSDEEPVQVAEVARLGSEVRREIAAQPFIRDGVRFSSLFRPA